jgi:hypothetical protein
MLLQFEVLFGILMKERNSKVMTVGGPADIGKARVLVLCVV